MKLSWFLLLPVSSLPACIAAENAVPSTTWSAEAATKFVDRGMVLVDNDVLQTTIDNALPVRDDGLVAVHVFGNLDLHDDVGDAWFPDGNAGRFSQIELSGSYTRSIGAFDVTAGVASYNVPRGNLFPNGERGSTNEVFATVATDVAGVRPQLEVHYDYDEVDGFYLRGGVGHDIALGEKLSASLWASLGWSDEEMSFWNYGIPSGLGGAGLADLMGTVRLAYAHDANTTFQVFVSGSTMIDDDLRDWFELIGIDEDQVWAGAGVGWSF